MNVIKQNMGTILVAMAVVVLMVVALLMAVGEINKTVTIQPVNTDAATANWGMQLIR